MFSTVLQIGPVAQVHAKALPVIGKSREREDGGFVACPVHTELLVPLSCILPSTLNTNGAGNFKN